MQWWWGLEKFFKLCIPVHFAHQAQLNAHVQPLEAKMVVGRENDEYVPVHKNSR
jgi:hypothetical protein